MASSANFTANLQYVPSIFEITAAEFLDNLLYPALNKLCDFLGWNYSIKIKEYSFKDDISPAVVMALQYLYLKKRGGSFGECFYGLERINTGNGNKNSKHFTSALLLVMFPYLEKKLKSRAANHETKSIIETLLLKGIYIFQIAKTINALSYLSKITKNHSPIFKALGLELKYSPPAEDKITFAVLKSIEVFAFFLQFIQWWYTRPNNKIIGNLKNPNSFDGKCENMTAYQLKNKCPICFQTLRIPTASAISGYVYCWKCISMHLSQKKDCPVSGLPMDIDDVIRVYDS